MGIWERHIHIKHARMHSNRPYTLRIPLCTFIRSQDARGILHRTMPAIWSVWSFCYEIRVHPYALAYNYTADHIAAKRKTNRKISGKLSWSSNKKNWKHTQNLEDTRESAIAINTEKIVMIHGVKILRPGFLRRFFFVLIFPFICYYYKCLHDYLLVFQCKW